jgi:nucleoporin SEH1
MDGRYFVGKNKIKTDHEEIIHDIAFDFYGKRVATCGSDWTVKVFDLNEETGKWVLSGSTKVHEGAIWRVSKH